MKNRITWRERIGYALIIVIGLNVMARAVGPPYTRDPVSEGVLVALGEIYNLLAAPVAPTGSATAANQTTGLTNQTTTNTNLGAPGATACATDTASCSINQFLQRIAQRLSSLITAVGTPAQQTGAVVGLTTQGYTASASITRTNDTNAYLANDVIGAATGSTAAITFSSIGPSAGDIIVTSVELEIDAAAIISGETSYNLYLYNVTPPSALGDNAAFDIPSGDRASFVGKISLGTPADEGSTLYIRTDVVNAHVKLSSANVFGYLVTVGAYTPTASRVYKVTLHAAGL